MVSVAERAATSTVLRPRRQLQGQSVLISTALVVPVFVALLWFAIPRGTWPRILVALAVVVIVYAIASVLLSRVNITITPRGITERGFFGLSNRVPANRIESVLLLDLYTGPSIDTVPQLFLLDASGALLLRMRGRVWTRTAIDTVATAFEVPIRRVDEPLTKADLRSEYSRLLYWMERWPVVQGLCMGGLIAASAVVLIAAMSPESLVIS